MEVVLSPRGTSRWMAGAVPGREVLAHRFVKSQEAGGIALSMEEVRERGGECGGVGRRRADPRAAADLAVVRVAHPQVTIFPAAARRTSFMRGKLRERGEILNSRLCHIPPIGQDRV